MGTISDKLTYLNTTKGKIKDSINLTGAGITDQDTFRSYETKLKDGFVDIINNGVDTLYENFPKVAQTGEEPTLNGVYEAPMRVDLNGNTEQDSYTGKNLFDYITPISRPSYNGITCTIEGDTIVFNGTATADNTTFTFATPIEMKQGTTKVIAYYVSGSATTYCTLRTFDSSYNLNTSLDLLVLNSSKIKIEATSQNNYTCPSASIRFNNGAVANNFKIKIMITDSDNTDFEPYVGGTASPNPDYPQPIRVVKGDNTIKVTGKNLFDKNNANMLLDDVAINGTTGVIADAEGFYTLKISCKPNTTYTISKVISSRFIVCYTNNATYTSGETLVEKVSNNSATNLTITTGENAKSLYVFYSKLSEETTYSLQQILDSIQIEYGSTSTTYEPYQEQTYPLNLGTTELCKIGDYKDEIRKSTGKNIITTYNYASSGYINYNYDNSKIGKTMTYSFIPNFSTTNATLYIRANTSISSYNVGTISTITSGTKVSVTFTLTDEQYNTIKNTTGGYIQVYKSEVSMDENSISNPMLEENNQATDYEPFGKVWYLKKNIGKIDLSTLTWSSAGADTSDYRRYYTNTIPNIKYVSSNTQVGNGIAEKYKVVKGQGISNLINVLAIDVSIVSVIDLESNNNPTGLFYYALATPTIEEITATTLIEQLEDLKTAKSVEGQTNITQTNEELPFILDVSGLKKD